MSENITIAGAVRIANAAGAERVGNSAANKIAELTEAYAAELVKKSISFRNHAKRKTLHLEDVEQGYASMKA